MEILGKLFKANKTNIPFRLLIQNAVLALINYISQDNSFKALNKKEFVKACLRVIKIVKDGKLS